MMPGGSRRPPAHGGRGPARPLPQAQRSEPRVAAPRSAVDISESLPEPAPRLASVAETGARPGSGRLQSATPAADKAGAAVGPGPWPARRGVGPGAAERGRAGSPRPAWNRPDAAASMGPQLGSCGRAWEHRPVLPMLNLQWGRPARAESPYGSPASHLYGSMGPPRALGSLAAARAGLGGFFSTNSSSLINCLRSFLVRNCSHACTSGLTRARPRPGIYIVGCGTAYT